MHREAGSRGREDDATARSTRSRPQAGEAPSRPPSLRRELGPADALSLDFWPPQPQENQVLCLKSQFVAVCCSSHRDTNPVRKSKSGPRNRG